MAEKNSLLEKIEQLVQTIYTPDQVDIDGKFLQFLEALEQYMIAAVQGTEIAEWNENLLKVQSAYVVKDYVTLSDVLLYEIKDKVK